MKLGEIRAGPKLHRVNADAQQKTRYYGKFWGKFRCKLFSSPKSHRSKSFLMLIIIFAFEFVLSFHCCGNFCPNEIRKNGRWMRSCKWSSAALDVLGWDGAEHILKSSESGDVFNLSISVIWINDLHISWPKRHNCNSQDATLEQRTTGKKATASVVTYKFHCALSLQIIFERCFKMHIFGTNILHFSSVLSTKMRATLCLNETCVSMSIAQLHLSRHFRNWKTHDDILRDGHVEITSNETRLTWQSTKEGFCLQTLTRMNLSIKLMPSMNNAYKFHCIWMRLVAPRRRPFADTFINLYIGI